MKLDTFVGKSYVAQSPNSDCEETINLFLEQNPGSAKSPFTFYKTPGLLGFFTAPNGGPIRGMLPLNQLPNATDGVWVCAGAFLYLIDHNANIITTRGPIPNDGNGVALAASSTQLVVQTAGQVYWVDGVAPFLHGPITWFLNPKGGPAVTISDVGFIDTYFVFLDQGFGNGFYFSEPGDVSIVPPFPSQNFIGAESSANKYTAMDVDREEIWLHGSLISQVYYDNSANNPNTPFAPNLSAVIPVGTNAPSSVTTIGLRRMWLGSSKTSTGVAWTNDGGYVARPISNPSVAYLWSTYPTTADAIGWGFTIKNHTLWRLWFPSADVTWEYDLAMDDWRKVMSWDETHGVYHAHPGRTACAAFSSILVGDRTLGIVYKTSMDYLNNNGTRNRWMRRCPVLSNENKRVSYPWFELDIQPGVGDGSNADITQGAVTPEAVPNIMIRWSNDWAQNWSNEYQRSMGKQGEYLKRVYKRGTGAARQRVFEASGTASVKTVINGCYLRDPGVRST